MSAPDTNVPKQARQHRWPLIGMIVVVAAALLGLVYWLTWEADRAPPPGAPETASPAGAEEEPATGAILPPNSVERDDLPEAAPLTPVAPATPAPNP